jgi:hypothetical protein
MGTSTGYDAPPSWGPLKSDVTRTAHGGSLTPDKAGQLLSDFVRHNGGASHMARGGGGVAGGGAARAVASRLGAFLGAVGSAGLAEALRQIGLSDLAGRPVREILNAIMDRLGGPSSTIDEVDARMALSRLQDKHLDEAETAEDVERILSVQVTDLGEFLKDYFGFYLYEVFCRVFFERLVQRVGETRATSFLGDIEDFINSTLTNRTAGQDLARVDLTTPAGQALVSDVMETTLRVFGG